MSLKITMKLLKKESLNIILEVTLNFQKYSLKLVSKRTFNYKEINPSLFLKRLMKMLEEVRQDH